MTLLELLVGVAVASILLSGLVGLMARVGIFKQRLGETLSERHRVVVLEELLMEDMTHVPEGDPSFSASPDQFTRTTVRTVDGRRLLEGANHGERSLRLPVRVRYGRRPDGDQWVLTREVKLLDLQDEYREPEELLRDSTVRFEYRLGSGRWVSRVENREGTVDALRVITSERTIYSPVVTSR